MDKLFTEAHRNGCKLNENVDFVSAHDELSAYGEFVATAKADIEPNEVLISCPFEYAITYETALASLQSINPDFKSLSQEIVLYTFLVLESLKTSNSKWAAYIEYLPKSFNTPTYFNDEDKQYLKATNIEFALQDRLHNWRHAYEDVLKLGSFSTNQFTFDLFIWAATVFTSRCFSSSLINSRISKEDASPILLPLIDSLNHKAMQPILWKTDVRDTMSVQLVSQNTTSRGQQIFNNYGPKGNEELLLGYGFCLEDNAFDNVALRVSVHPDLPYRQQKTSVLQQDNTFELNNLIFFFQKNANFSAYEKVLQCLTVVSASSLELKRILAHQAMFGLSSYNSSLRGKIKSFEILLMYINSRLQLLIHNNPDKSPTNIRQQYASVYRKGQIEILEQSLEQVKNFMEVELKKVYHPHPNLLQYLVLNSVSVFLLQHPNFALLSKVITELYGTTDAESIAASEEQDNVVLLICLYCLSAHEALPFSIKMLQEGYPASSTEEGDEVFEIFDEMIFQRYPDVFGNKKIFNKENMSWALQLINEESIDFSGFTFVIVHA
ncbi:ribosomal lysine methyltransferase Set10 [Schizosaccharomyces osmophilus]|uniref:Ribosomal lysine methyltransferase Set10 n=1 Tax=Schizosaccharomyces osmophilus TaxID=2545709 RepID=A0AAF0AV72_9SCHI|nr:ribosomal lysine methyltransferase Set10 [Schizosaccharomyces osmophilus]WBW71675.1 ribosomal lysine methyltransferase Set10 [Schizosaccharomyces osmophilus]